MHKEFKVGNHVFLKVKAKRSCMSFGNCSKMTTCYYGPFEILERIGPITYILVLPTYMHVHSIFHVSLLKRYVHDDDHVIDWTVMIQVE
jgi:hypothetical protein